MQERNFHNNPTLILISRNLDRLPGMIGGVSYLTSPTSGGWEGPRVQGISTLATLWCVDVTPAGEFWQVKSIHLAKVRNTNLDWYARIILLIIKHYLKAERSRRLWKNGSQFDWSFIYIYIFQIRMNWNGCPWCSEPNCRPPFCPIQGVLQTTFL